jgi:multidrug resistance protein, MATE family
MSVTAAGDGGARTNTNKTALTHRAVLAIAVPIVISNVSTPLIGIVNTAIVGRIPSPVYIGAVAVGALIFTFAFWGFGFLRMGTTGLTAQAFGAGDNDELAAGLGRALLIAAAAGVGLILLQWPIRECAFALVGASPEVERVARGYFNVRIWSGPATLANYALLGWFIGLGRTKIGLVLQLVLNLTNVVLDALFVLGFGWGVPGVALGTVLAEYVAAVVGIMIALDYVRRFGGHWSLQRILSRVQLERAFFVNSDIMIRSLALLAAFGWFLAQGARQGNVILAGNSILMQFIEVCAFFLDGFAFAAEALVGRAVGAAQRAGLTAAVRITTIWAAGIAVLLTLVLFAFGHSFIDGLTVDTSARAAARAYLPWAAAVPLLGIWAFQLDGIFIGATRTADMRNAMLVSLAVFLLAWRLLVPFGNAGLWAAFYVHYVARAGSLLYYYPALVRSVAGPGTLLVLRQPPH